MAEIKQVLPTESKHVLFVNMGNYIIIIRSTSTLFVSHNHIQAKVTHPDFRLDLLLESQSSGHDYIYGARNLEFESKKMS